MRRRGEELGDRLFKTRTQNQRMVGNKTSEISLARDPTICSCEYRNCKYFLRWRSLWGHEA
eukprot:6223874-Pyramimonas_sp.AAC.1